MRHSLFALLLIASPLAAQQNPVVRAPANSEPHTFGWVVDGSLEMGGDVLVEVLFTDGSRQKIYTGQGGTISFGVDLRPASIPKLGVRALVGYKFTTTAAENSNMSFTRIPIELVGSYHFSPDWRVGGGLAYHTGINFNGDGFTPDVAFDAAAGATIELGWRWAALTYTAMDYTADGSSIDASAIGVSFSWVFGKR